MRIAILGGPGSGKEIQARRLAERFRVPCISAADLLRKAADDSAPGGKTAARSKSAAAPKSPSPSAAADDTERVVRLLEERLRARDTKRGFVIDGFPRSIPEAQELDTLLEMFGRALQIAVCLQIEERALIKRLTEQLECAACGALYDRRLRRKLPAEARALCDACGGALTASSGHSAKTAAAQIAAYRLDAEPLANYYKAQHKLRTLSGGSEGESVAEKEDAADEMQQKIVDLVNLEINPLEVKNLEPATIEPDEHDGIIIAGGQINRIDPTEDILAARRPGQESAGEAATATAKTVAKKKVEKKPPAAVKTVKKPAPANKTATKKPPAKRTAKPPAGKAAKKPAAKKSTQRPAKKPLAKKPPAKPAAKPTTKKAAKKTAKKVAKKSGHG